MRAIILFLFLCGAALAQTPGDGVSPPAGCSISGCTMTGPFAQTATTAPLIVTVNATGAVPASFAGNTAFEIVGKDATNNRVVNETFGGVPAFWGRRAQGTLASISGVTSALNLVQFGAVGYDGTAYSAGAQAQIGMLSFNNWSTSDHSTYMTFSTTPSGSLVLTEAMRLQASGDLTIGSATDNVGKLQVTGGTVTDTLQIGTGSGAATAVAGAATLNTQNGTVTSEALVSATSYTLTLTNSFVKTTSTVLVNQTNSAALPVTLTSVTPGTGSVVIVIGMAALTGTAKITFIVMN